MADNNDIICFEESGIEYCTITGTGESGLTGNGVALSLGISRQAVSLLRQTIESAVSSTDLPKSLQPLHSKEFYCQVRYKNAKIYTSVAWACFAEYYAFEAKRTTDKALIVFRAFARIGAESYIQEKTGWLPDQYQSSKSARERINRILEKPSPWELMYLPELCIKIQKWYGFDSSKFYWWYCYNFLSQKEKLDLEKHNPLIKVTSKAGNTRVLRRARIHQHLSEETRARLHDFADYLWRLIDLCDSRSEFEKKWNAKYGQPTQLEIFDLWEFAD